MRFGNWIGGWQDSPLGNYIVSSRRLNPNDIYDFTQAAERRTQQQACPRAVASLEFLGWLNKYQKVRFWRMRKDMKWYLKQAQKFGVDEETARFLI